MRKWSSALVLSMVASVILSAQGVINCFDVKAALAAVNAAAYQCYAVDTSYDFQHCYNQGVLDIMNALEGILQGENGGCTYIMGGGEPVAELPAQALIQ